MRSTIIVLALIPVWATLLSAQEPPVVLHGRVLGGDGEPVDGANVFVLATLDGALSDSAGWFEVRSAAAGAHTLVVKARGHAEWRSAVTLPEREPVAVALVTEVVHLPPIEVKAGQYVATDAPDAALTSLQVVTTPGAQADVYRALQTFPGLQQVGEGAGLFVRGGDVAETRVFLNDALVLSPYRYESPTGGFFGAFDPFLLDGIAFSSGGFGARWGDALSGVASLETRGRPSRTTASATVSLAALSATASARLPAGLGAHATATRSHTRLLFDVNGTTSEFTRVPEGRDLSASAIWSYDDDGELKVFGIDQWNQLGVVVDEPSYSGAFETDERHDMVVASWRDRLGVVRPSISVSTAGADREQSFGVFAFDASERVDQLRAHAAIDPSPDWTFTAGAELERRTSRFRGSLPERDHDVEPGAPRTVFDSRVRGERIGAFAEAEWVAVDRLRVTTGLRVDRSSLTEQWTLDPRIAAAFRLSRGITLTGAWGVYHQVPAPFFFEPGVGDPTLGPMRAVHWILGAQAGSGQLLLRAEAYVKTYRDLAQWTRSSDIARGGTGSSRGLDIFVRWPPVAGISGRVAYSFLRARRTDPDAGAEARSPLDISRVSSIVLEHRFGPSWTVAAAYRASTGRPYTPVLGATHDAERDVWVPEYGEPMAQRLPGFRRLDLSVSRLLALPGAELAVLFVGVTNALDRENLFGYRYSEDYAQRIPVRSQFKRSIYFGASVTF